MGKKDQRSTAFSFEGRFLGFVVEGGYKLKQLRLMTATGERCVKLSKEARASVGGVLLPGDWIQVDGEQTSNTKTDVAKLKAYRVSRTSPRSPDALPSQTAIAKPKTSATILVCQKSDCMKRGGKAVCHALQAALDDRGLTEQVQVKGTGCMKQCKAGPNLIMPDKTRHTRVLAAEIPTLIDDHVPHVPPVESNEDFLDIVKS